MMLIIVEIIMSIAESHVKQQKKPSNVNSGLWQSVVVAVTTACAMLRVGSENAHYLCALMPETRK